MDGVGGGAGLRGQDFAQIATERHDRNALSRKDPGVGRAHAVPVHGSANVDQPDVVDVMRLGVGHRPGDGPVQRLSTTCAAAAVTPALDLRAVQTRLVPACECTEPSAT